MYGEDQVTEEDVPLLKADKENLSEWREAVKYEICPLKQNNPPPPAELVEKPNEDNTTYQLSCCSKIFSTSSLSSSFCLQAQKICSVPASDILPLSTYQILCPSCHSPVKSRDILTLLPPSQALELRKQARFALLSFGLSTKCIKCNEKIGRSPNQMMTVFNLMAMEEIFVIFCPACSAYYCACCGEDPHPPGHMCPQFGPLALAKCLASLSIYAQVEAVASSFMRSSGGPDVEPELKTGQKLTEEERKEDKLVSSVMCGILGLLPQKKEDWENMDQVMTGIVNESCLVGFFSLYLQPKNYGKLQTTRFRFYMNYLDLMQAIVKIPYFAEVVRVGVEEEGGDGDRMRSTVELLDDLMALLTRQEKEKGVFQAGTQAGKLVVKLKETHQAVYEAIAAADANPVVCLAPKPSSHSDPSPSPP